MRTLQRLRHVRLPEGEVPRIHSAERRRVQRREVSRWLRRARAGLRIASIVALVLLTGYWLWGGSFMAEALVEANLVVARAPARVRVAEVFVEPGQRCEVGTPLMRLESTRPAAERTPLEAEVNQRRVRLRLLDSGGGLGEADVLRRAEAVAEAERELADARDTLRQAEAGFARSRAERAALGSTLALRDARDRGDAAALEARSAEAGARLAQAQERESFQEFEAKSRLTLNVDGIVSDRDTASALTERDARGREIEALRAVQEAQHTQAVTARAALELAADEAVAQLRQADARIDEALTRVAGARTRVELWERALEARASLGTGGAPADVERLRALELELAAVELAAARARLEEFDALSGARVITAWTGGVVERVFAEPGAVVEADEPLVRYFEPARLHVVAYLEADDARRPRVGQACNILPLEGGEPLEGRVRSIDAALVPCPASLPRSSRGPTDMRLPVHIECDLYDQRALLQPNLRVRVAFSDEDAGAEAQAGLR